jgi:hypothetical protein
MDKLFVQHVTSRTCTTKKGEKKLFHFYRVYGTMEQIAKYQDTLTLNGGTQSWSRREGHALFISSMDAGKSLQIMYNRYQQRWFFDNDESKRYERLAEKAGAQNPVVFTYYMDKSIELTNLPIPDEIVKGTPNKEEYEAWLKREWTDGTAVHPSVVEDIMNDIHDNATDNPEDALDLPF